MAQESYAEAVERARERLGGVARLTNYTELLQLSEGLRRICDFYAERYAADPTDGFVRERLNARVHEYTLVQNRLKELRE